MRRETKAGFQDGMFVARLVAIAALGLSAAGCQDLQPGGPAPATGGGYGYGYTPVPAPLPPPPPPSAPTGFNPQDFAWSIGQGPSSLIGRVAYRSESGERWTCASQTIALIPAVRYSGERMRVLYGSDSHAVLPGGGGAQPATPRSRASTTAAMCRTAACDAHDAFSFARICRPAPTS